MLVNGTLEEVTFFFNDTATTEIYTLSLHDALPISPPGSVEASKVKLARPLAQARLQPALTPERQAVTLAPGETRTLPYDLELPPTSTPLDVFFLVDTTGSTQPVIGALRLAARRGGNGP